MKNILLIALVSLSATAHAAFQSQTLIRFSSTGAIQTLPSVTVDQFNMTPGAPTATIVRNAALAYDQGPSLAVITHMGGNFALTGDSIMRVSETGSLFTTKATFVPEVIKGKDAVGGNYFINKGTKEVIAIDSSGCYNPTGITANNVRLVGGNFYIDGSGVLTTIKHMGTAPCNSLGMVTVKTGLGDFSSAVKAGGNFFVNADGTLVGIASETGFYTNPQKLESRPKQIGGNYFVGEDKVLYTVSELGFVLKQSPILGKIKYYGYSYLIADDGYFIFIDGKGTPHTEMVQVFTNGAAQKIEKFKNIAEPKNSFIELKQ